MSDSIFRGLPKAEDSKKDDEQLPEELKGKSPSEIYKALQAEHIREMAGTTQEYTRKLEQLALQPPAPPVQNVPAPQFQPQGEEPQFDLSNPEAYLDHQVTRKMAPIVQSMVASGREAGRQLIQNKMEKGEWEKFGAEIEQFVDATSPQMQANAKIYEVARNFVRGQHVEEIISERTKGGLKQAAVELLQELGIEKDTLEERMASRDQKAAEPVRPSLFQGRNIPSVSAPRSASAAQSGPSKARLSSEEKVMCEKFNMTEDEYVLYRGENTDMVTALGRGGR